MLEHSEIDAISTATPEPQPHAATIRALQAGKNVYCEKPCSHNIFEAKQILAATRKYGKVVQHGVNARSHGGPLEAVRTMREHVLQAPGNHWPREARAGVNYDLWLGDDEETPNTLNISYEINDGGKKCMRVLVRARVSAAGAGSLRELRKAGWPQLGQLHQAVRAGDKKVRNNELEEGSISMAPMHLGNIACRLGRAIHFDPVNLEIVGGEAISRALSFRKTPGNFGILAGEEAYWQWRHPPYLLCATAGSLSCSRHVCFLVSQQSPLVSFSRSQRPQ